MSGKKSHFSRGECGELMFKKGSVGRIFDLQKTGEDETVENGGFVPFFSHFLPCLSHFPQPHAATTLHNPHPMCCPLPPPPPNSPNLPQFLPIFLRFPPVFYIFTIFPKSWFGEVVCSVVVSADACAPYPVPRLPC